MKSSEKTRSSAEINEHVEQERKRFQVNCGHLPQELTFVEGEEILAEVYLTLLGIWRTKMYVVGGTYAEAAAYIDGIKAGLTFNKNTQAFDAFLGSGFDEWLADRFGTARNVAWSVPIRNAFPDEAEAIVQIPILFSRYLHELRTGLWSREDGPVKKRKARKVTKGGKRDDA